MGAPIGGGPAQWYALTAGVLARARRRWHSLLAYTIVGGAAGGGTALLLPSYYESGAAFQAESLTPNPLSGALAGIASQIGNLPLGAQTSAQFFGDLLTTDAVLRRVAADSFPWRGQLASLPVIYGFHDKSEELRAYRTVRKLRRALRVAVSIRTGVVRFSVEARTPHLAKTLADSIVAALNVANIDLRRKRAAAERTFTSDRAAHAREELHDAEQALAHFYERNRSIGNSPALLLEEAQLKRQVEMAQQVYVQLRLQEEQAAVQEVRNTPAISVIDPPLLPVRRSWPRRRLAAALGAVLGLTLGFASLALAAYVPRH